MNTKYKKPNNTAATKMLVQRLAPLYVVITLAFYLFIFISWRKNAPYNNPINWVPLVFWLVVALALPFILALNQYIEKSGQAAINKRAHYSKIICGLIFILPFFVETMVLDIGHEIRMYQMRHATTDIPYETLTFLSVGVPIALGLFLFFLGHSKLASFTSIVKLCFAIFLAAPLTFLCLLLAFSPVGYSS